jgi:chemotaxis protein MotB
MKKTHKAKKENGERWLLTYSDMITLLLALFILLYGMSTVDQSKYEQLASSLNQSLGDGKRTSIFDNSGGIMNNSGNSIMPNVNGNGTGKQGSATATITPSASITPVPSQAAGNKLTTQDQMNSLQNGINDILNNLDVKDSAGTAIEDRGLTISLANDAFFASGKADLNAKMKKGLSQIAKLLNKVNNPIIIEGYTDNVPIKSSTYGSNWQLSGARSTAVAEFLADKQHVDGTRISAVGYGQYRPLVSNKTAAGRKKNRRVEITILYNEAAGMEFSK